ncbi:hypothetical protein AOPFMNJM_2623 [Methylobacterium jeotgali]|uniref:Uncharacterized protein n=1 Tax=Methylobacterium jeotgali TaxID=381630 RepID=A0ABQ4SWN0_9HYPH|nr:hypothetical protein AOPFMNJM_2623 [Methylobacterium jeotgali]
MTLAPLVGPAAVAAADRVVAAGMPAPIRPE